MKKHAKKWLASGLRWGIAVVGVYLVVKNIAFRDRVITLDPASGDKVDARVLGDAKDTDATFHILIADKNNSQPHEVVVGREALWAKPDRARIAVRFGSGVAEAKLLAVHPGLSDPRTAPPSALLVVNPENNHITQVNPSQVVGLAEYLKDHIPYPLVEVGLNRMVREADVRYLLLALTVIPIAFALTTYRWHLLLEAVGIHIAMLQTFAVNMVGLFYNTFMPGSTGGDLVKAWYASKHTPHRTWAVISVLMDRAIGLLALVILGGAMAAYQWQTPACRKVAIVSGALLALTAVGLTVFYTPLLRRLTGFDFIVSRLPGQHLLQTAIKGLEMYGHDHPSKTILALILCFPVHMTSIASAMMAGHAFGLSLPPLYYWVIVPVIALVGAIPISPQGAGVMEGMAILLTRRQGVTVSQAVALTLAIRLVQIFWNLIAGLFVLRGGYHAPTETEQHELDEDEPPPVELHSAPVPVQV
jgi:uncharacterized protein (TIRG00374 family)